MAVYQEKDKGTWRVVFRYTDFTGERKQTQKRGFKTKREATAWEHEMMLRKGNKLDMTFESFYEIYSEYKRPADFDFEKQTVRINKTYHRMKKQDIITSPKTAKSNRIVVMPEFLCEEMQDYFQMYYSLAQDQRIFPFSKSYLKHEMERGCKATGVPVIRIHDLRHSHVSLLIHMRFTALAIGNRVGHEAEKITYRYAHLFPTVQTEMANKLDVERMEKEDKI